MNFTKGNNGNNIKYPLTQRQINSLKDSKFVSPKVGKQNGLRNYFEDKDLGVYVDEVVDVRLQIQRGNYPQEFLDKYYPFDGECPKQLTQPLINSRLSKNRPDGLANVVHMDTPMDMSLAILKWLASSGVKLKDNDDDQILFTETICDVIESIANGVKKYANMAFEVKYYYGVPRPEEVSSHGLGLTHYPEGCPNHPSYPAGHGAIAGGGVLAFFEHFDLLDTHKKIILDTAYLWAMFRTFAGVHYGADNVAGLALSLSEYFTEESKKEYNN